MMRSCPYYIFNKHIEMRYFIETILNGVAAYVLRDTTDQFKPSVGFFDNRPVNDRSSGLFVECVCARAQALDHNLIVCISATHELIFIVMPGIYKLYTLSTVK